MLITMDGLTGALDMAGAVLIIHIGAVVVVAGGDRVFINPLMYGARIEDMDIMAATFIETIISLTTAVIIMEIFTGTEPVL